MQQFHKNLTVSLARSPSIIMKQIKSNPLGWMIGVSTLILFACSSVRHALFQSSALDLGIFDQGIYLISQGQNPICSIVNFHILADHAAWVLYPLAILYKIYPDVHWLLAIQATALALGALPTWHLARQAGLTAQMALALSTFYLLYPLVFNINLFDFHPEVMALPALLGVVLAARLGRSRWFYLGIAFILGCKAVLSLTVAAMGIWLLVFEKRRRYGFIALFVGISWFFIASQGIIPFFKGGEPAAVERYAYLGNSVSEIALNLLLKPGLVLGKVFSLANLEYICLLFLPFIWGLAPKYLTPLIAAIPTVGINIITDYQAQKDLTHQYSLPALPFFLLAIIATLANGRGWVKNPRGIVVCGLIVFLALAKFGYFGSKYLESLDTWQASKEAVTLIRPEGGVLTTDKIAPHLTHRPLVKLAIGGSESSDLSQFNYVLLNARHPGWGSSPEIITTLLQRLRTAPEFKLNYERDQVYLFEKKI